MLNISRPTSANGLTEEEVKIAEEEPRAQND